MKVIVFGAGRMGQAIVHDLCIYSSYDITMVDRDVESIENAKKFLERKEIDFIKLDLEKTGDSDVKQLLQRHDIAVSALPYRFNFYLAKQSVKAKTHFLDLGGNHDIVDMELRLMDTARKNNVTVIPDCGLAPGLVSIITHDIVDQMDTVEYVKLRVGGVPVHPKPPFNYQLVFSPEGLINEYVEDAIVLDHEKIVRKKSMTELETLQFPEPFGTMEAFLTSGGISTLPYTYKDRIKYLDYKTVRYPGHCEKFRTLLGLGLAEEKEISIGNTNVVPRIFFAALLSKKLPQHGKDAVLLKVVSRGTKNEELLNLEYTMIDYYDEKNNISAMMRTTGYTTSVITQMIADNVITQRGVFCPENIVPPKIFFDKLRKRGINISRRKK
ncbi:MAG: saccharopine dehydrogenase [Thermoplasmata archaeon]|nr:MAG: saccharopine dehydrogenase [Thermoplasmata archaeon]